MKAMLLPLAATDVTSTAGEDSAPSEKGGSEAFDAVLALVAAQAANLVLTPKAPVQAAPVLVALPVVTELTTEGRPSLSAEAGRGLRSAKFTGAAADVVASDAFAPWLAGQIAAAQAFAPQLPIAQQAPPTPSVVGQVTQTPADETLEREPTLERGSADANLMPAQDPRLAVPPNGLAIPAPVPASATSQVSAPTALRSAPAGAAPRPPLASGARPQADAHVALGFQSELVGARAQMVSGSPPATEQTTTAQTPQTVAAQPPVAQTPALKTAQAVEAQTPVAQMPAPKTAQAVEAQTPAAQTPAPKTAQAVVAQTPAVQTPALKTAQAVEAQTPAVQTLAMKTAQAVEAQTPVQTLAMKTAQTPAVQTPAVQTAAAQTPVQTPAVRTVHTVPTQAIAAQAVAARTMQTPAAPTIAVQTPAAPTIALQTPAAPTIAVQTPAAPTSALQTSGVARAQLGVVEAAAPEDAMPLQHEVSGAAPTGAESTPELAPESSDARDELHEEAGPEREALVEGQPSGPPQTSFTAQRAHQSDMLRDTEVQGARGLEAVVASLLRVGSHDATDEKASVRVSMQAGVQLQAGQSVAAVNASATRVKLAEGVASTSGALDQAARERDDELMQARELLELPLSPAAVQPEPAPRRDAAVGPAEALIVPVIPQLVDADVQPGQAGLGGAKISINHPELGAMDLLVQSQNGRIEVRAVLETPHAAQVLRAQESALRYGIQQAGMTFGALRVRARTGDGETVKARDNTKRRRDHEWEA